MPARRRIATAVAVLAVALAPGAALAQNGAGDDQYSDPFADGSQPAPKKKPKASAPVQPVPHQQVPSSTTPQSQTLSSTQAPTELPRTGTNLLPLTLLGVALIAAGALLLRRRAGAAATRRGRREP